MKPAEEWYNDQLFSRLKGDAVEQIKQIQLDAIKEGMRRAASTTSRWMTNNRLHPDIPNENLNESATVHSVLQQAAMTIVDASDNLETKDL